MRLTVAAATLSDCVFEVCVWPEAVIPMAMLIGSEPAVFDSPQRIVSVEPLHRPRRLIDDADRDDGVVIVDERGRILLVNTCAEQLFGYDRGALLGQHIEVLVPSAKRADHVALRRGFSAGPHLRPLGLGMHLSGRCRDSSEILVEVSLRPLRTVFGNWVLAGIRGDDSHHGVEQLRLTNAVADAAVRIGGDLRATVIADLFDVALRLESIAARTNIETRDDVIGVIDRLDVVIREIRDVVLGLGERQSDRSRVGGRSSGGAKRGWHGERIRRGQEGT